MSNGDALLMAVAMVMVMVMGMGMVMVTHSRWWWRRQQQCALDGSDDELTWKYSLVYTHLHHYFDKFIYVTADFQSFSFVSDMCDY